MLDRPVVGIATDAAHSMKRNETEYQAVDLATGKRLFYRNIGEQTVNIGEFLAVVDAIKFIIENGCKHRTIYTDSQTAIAWVKAKKTASKKRNADLRKAEAFLLALSRDVDSIEVLHWSNKVWGETPADFGNK